MEKSVNNRLHFKKLMEYGWEFSNEKARQLSLPNIIPQNICYDGARCSIKKEMVGEIENNLNKTDMSLPDNYKKVYEIVKNSEARILNTIVEQLIKFEIQDKIQRVEILQKEVTDHIITQANIPVSFQTRCPTVPFIGRAPELTELEICHNNKKLVVVSGPKGVGKSEFACKYAHDFKHKYSSNIVWINAESYDSMISSFKDLAVVIGTNLENKGMTTIIREMLEYFNRKKTLFIFDNCSDDNAIVHNLLNFVGEIKFINVIITSVSEKWDSIFKIIRIKNFEKHDAIEYLESILRKELNDMIEIHYNKCERLAKILNYCPVALKKATGYIIEQNILLGKEKYSIDDYINQFAKKEEVPMLLPRTAVPRPVTPESDIDKDILNALQQELNKKLGCEATRIGVKISIEATKAEKRVWTFFRREVEKFFKKNF